MKSDQQMQNLVESVMGEMTTLETEYALEPAAFDSTTGDNEVAWYIAYRTDSVSLPF